MITMSPLNTTTSIFSTSPVIDLDVLVNGKPVKKYVHENNFWIEGREGSSYTLRVKNNTHLRLLIVASVDGINVITGKECTSSSDENGYIIEAKGVLHIEGWRISNSSVKEFVFTFNKEKSYAVKLGAGKSNLGVLGIMAFAEQLNYNDIVLYSTNYWYGKQDSSVSTNSAHCSYKTASSYEKTSSATTVNDFSLGTAKGKEVQSGCTEVQFTPMEVPLITSLIYYDSYDNLQKKGIIPNRLPQAFRNTGFCPDL